MQMRQLLGRHYDYSPLHRCIEIWGIVSFFLFSAFVLTRIFGMMDGLNSYWAWFLFIKSILVAYVAADFASGFVHWLGDTFGEEHWPVLGAGFIMPFRQHHVDPQGICRHDFIEVNGNNCIVLFLYLIPIYLITPSGGGYFAFFFLCFNLFFAIGIFCTNQFHKWAHMDNPPAWIHALQRWGLILSPKNHDVHHAAPYKTYYCITSGWMNPVLDKIRFWRFCEGIMTSLTGRDYSGDPGLRKQEHLAQDVPPTHVH